LNDFGGVSERGAEGLGAVDRASNQPVKNARGVCRTRREIQVEVQGLLVKDVMKLGVLKSDGQIKEDDLITSIAGDPFEAMPAVETALEPSPQAGIDIRIGVTNPHTKDVINVALGICKALSKRR
jgi:hypothetical protein